MGQMRHHQSIKYVPLLPGLLQNTKVCQYKLYTSKMLRKLCAFLSIQDGEGLIKYLWPHQENY